jgi:hypothetical protein
VRTLVHVTTTRRGKGAAHGRPRRRCVERNASITARTTRGGRPVSDDVNDVNDMIRSVSLSQL